MFKKLTFCLAFSVNSPPLIVGLSISSFLLVALIVIIVLFYASKRRSGGGGGEVEGGIEMTDFIWSRNRKSGDIVYSGGARPKKRKPRLLVSRRDSAKRPIIKEKKGRKKEHIYAEIRPPPPQTATVRGRKSDSRLKFQAAADVGEKEELAADSPIFKDEVVSLAPRSEAALYSRMVSFSSSHSPPLLPQLHRIPSAREELVSRPSTIRGVESEYIELNVLSPRNELTILII